MRGLTLGKEMQDNERLWLPHQEIRPLRYVVSKPPSLSYSKNSPKKYLSPSLVSKYVLTWSVPLLCVLDNYLCFTISFSTPRSVDLPQVDFSSYELGT